MRSFFGKAIKRTNIRKQPRRLEYGTLEDRRVLAALTSFSAATGVLSVSLDAINDSAIVSVDDGLVSVNGTTNIGLSQGGNSTVSVAIVRGIDIDGDATKTGQSVVLAGSFVTGVLENVSVDQVSSISIPGTYNISGDLGMSLVYTGGGIGDGDSGRLIVDGTTTINSRQNVVALNNANHDFRGDVSIRTAPIGQNNVQITDVNDINFTKGEIWGNFTVNAPNGAVTDSPGTIMNIVGDASFDAKTVKIGDSANDEANFFRINLNTEGRAEIHEDSNLIFSGSNNVGSLFVESEAGGIFDGRNTSLIVTNNAEFRGERIRIGEHSTDTFTAGSLTFRSTGHVDVFENDSTFIAGDNTARTLDITSQGNLTDANDATVFVEFTTGFEALNMYLGDTADDNWELGSFYFYTEGDLFLTTQSDIRIVEPKNFANRMTLKSDGSITDADDAAFEVATLARFIAVNEVTIGDTEQDEFNAGSIQWNTGEKFFVHEDSNTVISNIANSMTESPGAEVISDGSISNAAGAAVDVTGNMSFLGTTIFVGNRAGDKIEFGSLTVNTYEANGTADVSQDSEIVLTGNSHVRSMQLNSTSTITDAADAVTLVTGATVMRGTAVNVGDTASFNTAVVTVDSTGNVSVREDASNIVLTGISKANSLTLVTNGNVLDTEFAETRVNFLLDVTGNLINLGADETDVLSFRSLTFNSQGNTNIIENSISGEEGFTIVGDNFSGDLLILESNGDILDDDDAQIVVTNRASFTGVDVIIGDEDTDCFTVLNEVEGGESLVGVHASGVGSVTRGGC